MPFAPQLIPVLVQSRTSGLAVEALVAQCQACGTQEWLVYLVGEAHYMHLQCTACDTTYCAGHSCGAEDA